MATTLKNHREVLDLPLPLDKAAGNQPLQVRASLRAAILDGRLATGLRLPSSRALGVQLGIPRNAVIIAYELLQSDGLAEARAGAGTYVASQLPTQGQAKVATPYVFAAPKRRPFALGNTHMDAVLLRGLAAALRKRVLHAEADDLGYGDPRGNLGLRQQIAIHLAQSRGVVCDASCIVIISGTQQGLRLCADTLLCPGDAVWMEDPGYPAARRTLMAAGLQLVPVRVDGEGIDVAAGQRHGPGARAAYITPSHQYPTGVRMSMARRSALLDWARSSGAWLFEDDYDSEFRYGGAPLTALAGIGGSDRVIYFGTFSKTLCAGLRVAYMVLPPAAVESVLTARAAHDRFPASFAAGAIADLMANGMLADHTRRMRRRYRIARDTVATALEISCSGALEIMVPSQGLHLLAYLPQGAAPGIAAKIRDMANVEAWLLSETRLVPADQDGFILGFAGYDLTELTQAATALGQAARVLIEQDKAAPMDHADR